MNHNDSILSITATLGISASILILAANSSPAAAIATSALVTLSIAGMAWLLDQQNTQVAKNTATVFAKNVINNTESSPNKDQITILQKPAND